MFCFILRRLARLKRIILTTSIGLLLTRISPADSTATSVPLPMAMPTSARDSAGASFTPSPTMATTLPWACSAFTLPSLSSGSTCAKYWSMSSSAATAAATSSLSPVSMATSMSISCSAWMAS